jgi:hypothetical protein
MLRLRISLLSLVAVCAVGMFSAAAASAAGPFWYVNGGKLEQGSRLINGQSKGNLVLRATVLNITFRITCTASHSVGTIDGQGPTLQGQDKGKVKYEGCTIATEPEIKECEVAKTLETNQLKSHLATATVQSTEQIVDLFEPTGSSQTTAKPFIIIKLTKCGVLSGAFEVTGSVVGQIIPQETESQKGILNFPEPPITEVTHEGQKQKDKLSFGGNEATFTGVYQQELQGATPFGVKKT